MNRLTIIGTGLIGASIGLALREQKFGGEIFGWDKNPAEVAVALSRGAIDHAVEDPITAATGSDLIVLAGPVFSILEWTDQLGPVLGPHQLVTDVGSVKGAVSERAARSFGGEGQARFLPGHPMAGKKFTVRNTPRQRSFRARCGCSLRWHRLPRRLALRPNGANG